MTTQLAASRTINTMDTELLSAYRRSSHRLLLLDYDGTLADLKATPPEAKPTLEILGILERLGNDTKNTVVVVSGRRHQELDEWLGRLPISLAAEHGLMFREYGQDGWQLTKQIDTSWKPAAAKVMQQYLTRIKGSLIEDKTNAMVWHYRNAQDTKGAEAAKDKLAVLLEPIARQHGLRVMSGSKIIEVLSENTNKGAACSHWLDKRSWDFTLAAGDDTTDEDMFRVMPGPAFTIKVRPGASVARIRLAAPHDMRRLLASLK
jgi:trehalose 6-phosphate synthase/phosphatase